MYIVLRLVATADGAESYRTHQIANVIDSYFKIIQNNAHAYRIICVSLVCLSRSSASAGSGYLVIVLRCNFIYQRQAQQPAPLRLE